MVCPNENLDKKIQELEIYYYNEEKNKIERITLNLNSYEFIEIGPNDQPIGRDRIWIITGLDDKGGGKGLILDIPIRGTAGNVLIKFDKNKITLIPGGDVYIGRRVIERDKLMDEIFKTYSGRNTDEKIRLPPTEYHKGNKFIETYVHIYEGSCIKLWLTESPPMFLCYTSHYR